MVSLGIGIGMELLGFRGFRSWIESAISGIAFGWRDFSIRLQFIHVYQFDGTSAFG